MKQHETLRDLAASVEQVHAQTLATLAEIAELAADLADWEEEDDPDPGEEAPEYERVPEIYAIGKVVNE